ncbi:MAG: hypothetical protein JXA78_15700 [Anaerolineales bacterium]|nr:hypothetical protein [Anaerolineales bacterium]
MIKKLFMGLFLLALALSACAPAAQVAETAAPAATSTQAATPVGQSTLSTNSETASKQLGCTAKSRSSAPDPTLEALLPPPGEDDWVEGPGDAYVTIIEYGDYQ